MIASPSLHRLFGITLAGGFPFTTRLETGQGTADLTVSLLDRSPVPGRWKREDPVYRSTLRDSDGESLARLYRLEGCEALCFSQVADFYLRPDSIACHPVAQEHPHLVEIRLLGTVLAYWLERQGLPTLHASAVQAGSRAVALLGRQGGGKSSLAAALMREGASLLTDDVLPVEERDGVFLGRPGYPQMRMWPDQADHFLGHHADLPVVHPGYSKRRVAVGPDGFGAFHGAALPLGCLYIVERRERRERRPEGPVEIHGVSPREAFFELVRHSFTPYLVEAAGLQPGRIDLFARLVRRVPVRRLVYPSGYGRLPEVAAAVLRDVERVGGEPPC
jgi:hypothetical protein